MTRPTRHSSQRSRAGQPIALAVAALAALAFAAGCTTSGQAHHAGSIATQHNSALVLPHDAESETDNAASWEFTRNDRAVGVAGSPTPTTFSVAEIRHREFLRITNGRPRNDSYTSSRSYERRSDR